MLIASMRSPDPTSRGLRMTACLAVACSLMVTAASAQEPSIQPPPDFKVDGPERSYDPPATYISASVDGCWGAVYGYSIDDFSCVKLELALWRGERLVTTRVPGFFNPGKGTSAAGQFVDWRCSGSRRYRYRVTYTNNSYVPNGVPYTVAKDGAFETPRCRKPVPRRVDRGTAAGAAFSANESEYEGEFISSVRCTASSAVRGGRASKWTCRTTHNNQYRICTDADVLTFTAASKWGERKRDYDVNTVSKRCRFF